VADLPKRQPRASARLPTAETTPRALPGPPAHTRPRPRPCQPPATPTPPLPRPQKLPRLAELSLADGPADSPGKGSLLHEALGKDALEALARCSALASLDLSRRPLCEEAIAVLCRQLPRLQHLHLHDCPLYGADLCALERRFPHVTLHRRVAPPLDGTAGAMLPPRPESPCSGWVH
jgi:hypothetical protein